MAANFARGITLTCKKTSKQPKPAAFLQLRVKSTSILRRSIAKGYRWRQLPGSGDGALRSNGDGMAIAVALNRRTLPNWNRMPNWNRTLSAGKPMNCRWPLHPSWEAALASAI